MEELRDLLLQVRNRLSSSQQGQSLQMILSVEESLRLLGTNDDPIKTKGLLQGPLNQCQTLLCQKRQEMTDLRCRLGALEEEERDLVNIAEKTKGLFSYIRLCPTEVVREIFLNCVDFYHSADKLEDDFHDSVRARLIHPHNAPLLLLHICKKWRRIALSTPKLFTQLYLPHGTIEGKEEMDSVLHLFLTYSGSLALDIFLQAKEYHRFASRRMDTVSAQLSPCFSRICRIRIPWDFVPRLFPPHSCTDAPALLDFRLYDKFTDDRFGRLVAPKLEVFSSPDDVDFDWEGFITFGECLKMFSGCYILEKPHQLFQNSANMEYCRINYIGSPTLLTCSDAPIFLPRLRDLSISTSSEACIPLLSQLTMPSIRALQLTMDVDTGHEGILRAIISSFNSARPSLKTLLIDKVTIQHEEFHDLLCILPELTTLTLRDCDLYGASALRALDLNYEPDICPKLAILDFKGSSFPYSGSSKIDHKIDIISVISSRACPRLSKDPEKRTQRCLRYMNLALDNISDVMLKGIQRMGNRYDIVIVGHGEENKSEDSDDGSDSDF